MKLHRSNLGTVTIVSFACAMMGAALIFEVIRPFRDMSKDGPLAMILWGVGVDHRLFCAATRDCPGCRGFTCKSDSALWRRRSARPSRRLDFDLALAGAAKKSDRSVGDRPRNTQIDTKMIL